MTSSEKELRAEAEALYERRLTELRQEAEQEKEAEREKGIRSAIKEVQEQRRQERIERVREQAEVVSSRLAGERYELEQEIESLAVKLAERLTDLEVLHARHSATLSQSGRPLDYGFSLSDIVTGWFRHRFGGFNSLTGTPAPFHASRDVPLHERDPLARADG